MTSGFRKTAALSALGAAAVWAARRYGTQRESFCGKTVIVTGGSRGLGLEMARLWGAEGARVAICARTVPDLKRAAEELVGRGVEVIAKPCDVRDREQVEQFVFDVGARWGDPHVLVNNAGVIQAGPQDCMTLADYRETMDTHFWGPLHAVLAVLPRMRRAGGGRIVNISSVGGKIGVPHMVPYCASKFALLGLSEGLRAELAHEGIVVTAVCPGLMRTGSPRNATFKGRHRAEYAWFSISDSLPFTSMNARRAARQIIEACRRGDAEAVLSPPAMAAVKFHGLFPGLTAAVLAKVNKFLPASGGTGTEGMKGWQSESPWSPSLLTTLGDRAAARNNEGS